MLSQPFRLGHGTCGVVVRPAGPGRGPHVLLFAGEDSDTLQVVEGDGSNAMPYKLGPRLQIPDADTGEAFRGIPSNPVYDTATEAVYFVHNCFLKRLDATNTVSLVARERCGMGITSLAADGRGSLYVADVGGIVFCRPASSGSREGASSQAVVIRACGGPNGLKFNSLACRAVSDDSSGGQELIAATSAAVYRLPLTEAPDGGPPSLGDPVLLAGREGEREASRDGTGSAARFKSVSSILLSPNGCSAAILDCDQLRKLDLATGAVTTLATLDDFKNPCTQMAWLPGGYLAVCCAGGTSHILLTPQLAHSNAAARSSPSSTAPASSAAASCAAPAGPSRRKRTLADVADLSERSGSGPSFVAVRVGPKVFDVHRAVLVEQSAYFRRLMAGSEMEMELADTDPAHFRPLLRYMYSGFLQKQPPVQLRSTAELAKRLQIDGALEELHKGLLTASTSETLVSDFLWAERHSFQPLAAELKERLLSQVAAVMATTPEADVAELAKRNPSLVAKMCKEAGSRMQR